MRTISRHKLWLFGVVGFAIIIASVILMTGYWSSAYPMTGGAFSVAPFFAFFFFSIAMIVAARTRRDLIVIDLVRVALWALVGFGIGVAQMSMSYYRHYFPQNADRMHSIGLAISGVAIGLIVMSVVIFPTPRRYPGNVCGKCGYDMRGASSSICPECGYNRDEDHARSEPGCAD